VPFVILVLRQLPLSNHGISSFELVFGFKSKTPLEAMYYNIMECDWEKLWASAWVEQLAERLQLILKTATLGTAHAIERRKQYHDKGA